MRTRASAATGVTGRVAALVLAVAMTLGVAPVAGASTLAAPAITYDTRASYGYQASPPYGTSVGHNPVLTWRAVSGAARYRVQISESAGFGSLVLTQDTHNVSFTPPAELPAGQLWWRVAALTSSGVVGDYAISSFTRTWGERVELEAPQDGETLYFPEAPVLFSWKPLRGAVSYRLEIDDAEDFIGAEVITTSNTSYAVTEPQTDGQTFYWRVQAIAGAGKLNTPWSDVRSYRFQWANGLGTNAVGASPSLVTPAHLAEVTDVELRWEPVQGAATYQVQVSPNQDWANNRTWDVVTKGTSFSLPIGLLGTLGNSGSSPAGTLGNAHYYWRVRARDAKNPANLGGWSEVREFTRSWSRPVEDRPSLIAPADSGIVDEPTFSWHPAERASYYVIEVSRDPNFSPTTSPPNPMSCSTTATTFTPYGRQVPSSAVEPTSTCNISLEVGRPYWWRVRAIDAPRGILGLVSEARGFSYQPDVPTLISPVAGEATSAPVLRWKPVTDKGRYRVTVINAKGATVVNNVATHATSYTPTTELKPADSPYTWFVRTEDPNGAPGLRASDGWFSVVPPVAGPSPLAALEPGSASVFTRAPALVWQPVTGASGYRVWLGNTMTGTFHNVSGTTKQHAFTYTGEGSNAAYGRSLPPGSYQWYVEAVLTSGGSVQGPTHTFRIAEYDEATYASPGKCAAGSPCEALPQTPTLDWEPVPDAGGYLVYVALDPNFTNVYRRYWTAHSTLTPRESYLDNQAGQSYYWFVRPCTYGGQSPCGRFETVTNLAWAFQKRSKPIRLTEPADGATRADLVTFRWEPYLDFHRQRPGEGAQQWQARKAAAVETQEAQSYRIEVSTVRDFTTLIDWAETDQPFYTPYNKTYPEGPLFWRVQAIDGSGNRLTHSEVRRVEKASPLVTLTAPRPTTGPNGTQVVPVVEHVPSFTWRAQRFAARYQVEVYGKGDTEYSATNRVLTQETKMAAWTPSSSLPAGTYAWRVRRLDADGRPGPWSSLDRGSVHGDTPTFHLRSSAPSLLLPADNAAVTGGGLRFAWNRVGDISRYRIEVSTDAGFTKPVEVQETVMTSWAPTRRYTDGTYYWRVHALNATGSSLAVSHARTLRVDTTAPTVRVKSPTSAAPLTGSFSVTFSEPVSGVSASTFRLTVAGTSTAVPAAVRQTSSTTATLTPTASLVPGQSYTAALTTGITDAMGNALVPMSWTVRSALSVEETEPVIRQTWDRDTHASASGGGYAASATRGANLHYTFTGTNVAVLGRRSPTGGYADIYLDGKKQNSAPVSFYSSSTQWQRAVWSKSGLAAGSHRLEIRVLGTKPTASKGAWVDVDAFRVGSALAQETATTVRHQLPRVSNASASGGGELSITHVASGDNGGRPEVQMAFRGTQVTWYATKSPTGGIATVYVNGSRMADVDLYSSGTTSKAVAWRSPTLPDRVHTVRIVVNGTKRSASKGTRVTVDRLLVR